MYFEKMNIVVCNFTDHYGERIINMTGVQILRCPKRRRTKLRIGCDTLGWKCRGPGLGGIWVGPGKKRPDAAIITDTLLTKQFSRINIHEGVMYLKRLFIAVWGEEISQAHPVNWWGVPLLRVSFSMQNLSNLKLLLTFKTMMYLPSILSASLQYGAKPLTADTVNKKPIKPRIVSAMREHTSIQNLNRHETRLWPMEYPKPMNLLNSKNRLINIEE